MLEVSRKGRQLSVVDFIGSLSISSGFLDQAAILAKIEHLFDFISSSTSHKQLIKLYFSPDYTVIYSTPENGFFRLLLSNLDTFLDNSPNFNVVLIQVLLSLYDIDFTDKFPIEVLQFWLYSL